MRRSHLILSLCVGIAILPLSVASSDSYVTILHFNDLHGYLQPTETDQGSVGGLGRMATMAEEVRDWNDAHGVTTLFLSAGDILQGTPLSTVYQGEPDFICLDLMDLDAMCIGNHEFDFGRENYRHLAALAKFPILSANIYVVETGEPFSQPFVLFTLADGTSAAAFGLTTPETAVQTSPKNVAGLRFTDPVEESKRLVPQLLRRADFIIAVTHLGYEEDLRLAEAVPELDVIIGGHSHTQVQPPTQVGKTLVCQAGSYGRYLGQLDMLVAEGEVVKYRGFLRPVTNSTRPDPQVQVVIDRYAGQLEKRLRQVVAHTAVFLDGEREHIRSRETNLGNLIADIFRNYTGADVCLINGGGIRASLAAGPITVGDLLTVVPFGNLIAIKEITGEQLRQVLEFDAGLSRPSGGFLQVSGLSMVISGKVLQEVQVSGAPLDPNETYTLATSEFLLSGGDGYRMLIAGAEPTYLGYTDNALVLDALRKMGKVSPTVEGRIVIE